MSENGGRWRCKKRKGGAEKEKKNNECVDGISKPLTRYESCRITEIQWSLSFNSSRMDPEHLVSDQILPLRCSWIRLRSPLRESAILQCALCSLTGKCLDVKVNAVVSIYFGHISLFMEVI